MKYKMTMVVQTWIASAPDVIEPDEDDNKNYDWELVCTNVTYNPHNGERTYYWTWAGELNND
jgi:hypothetical protein